MLEGITVLNSLSVYNNGYWWIGCILGCLAIGLSLWIDTVKEGAFFTLFAAIFFVLLIFGFAQVGKKEIGVQYQVTISDEANFNELCDRYEIIEQDGKIFTIEEKK